MTVRAKFKVESITRHSTHVVKKDESGKPVLDASGFTVYEKGEVHTLEFSAVQTNGDPNHENSKFWHASPGGSIKINCANAEVAKQFELGCEYYVDFTRAY